MNGDKAAKDAILRIAENVASECRPNKIILFGSYARGMPAEDSDVDLLNIKNADERPLERWCDVKRLLRGTAPFLPVAPLVYTEREIQDRLAIRGFFIEKILAEGEVLYG
jgi:predicted nucleotidyltransferase